MEVFEAIHTRQSIGQVKPEPVPRELIDKILAAAVQAPYHYKVRPWRFAVMTGAAHFSALPARRGGRMADLDHTLRDERHTLNPGTTRRYDRGSHFPGSPARVAGYLEYDYAVCAP